MSARRRSPLRERDLHAFFYHVSGMLDVMPMPFFLTLSKGLWTGMCLVGLYVQQHTVNMCIWTYVDSSIS